MLTAAVASYDPVGRSQLGACLQQTGLVSSVREISLPAERAAESPDAVPDVVLLDLARDPDALFALGAHLKRLRPTLRLIAASNVPDPNPQLLLEAMRSGVQDFLTKPIEPRELKELLARFLQESQPERKIGERLIIVMGSKGGVGATTVAVNLGVRMAQLSKRRTVLLDFSRPLGFVHLLLDVLPKFGVRDAVENLDRLDGHFLSGLLCRHKTNLEFLAGTTQAEEWDRISVSALERVVNVAQSSCETVLMDLGQQFSAEWSFVLRQARFILLIAETNVPSLWALERRLVALAGFGLDPDRVRIVVNRWHRGDEQALKGVEKNIKRPVFACLPNDYRLVSGAVNLGAPVSANHSSLLAARFQQLAALLTGVDLARGPKRGALSGLFTFSSKR